MSSTTTPAKATSLGQAIDDKYEVLAPSSVHCSLSLRVAQRFLTGGIEAELAARGVDVIVHKPEAAGSTS